MTRSRRFPRRSRESPECSLQQFIRPSTTYLRSLSTLLAPPWPCAFLDLGGHGIEPIGKRIGMRLGIDLEESIPCISRCVERRIGVVPRHLGGGNETSPGCPAIQHRDGRRSVASVLHLGCEKVQALPPLGRHLDRLPRTFPDDLDGHGFSPFFWTSSTKFGLVCASGFPAIVSRISLTLNPALAAGALSMTSVVMSPWSAGIWSWARRAGSTDVTETPIQNSGGCGLHGPEGDLDLGLDLKSFLLALMQQHQVERLVPRGLRRSSRSSGLASGTSSRVNRMSF